MSRRIAPYHVVAYDFGVKRNILRLLSDLDCRLTVVPATTSAEEVLALSPDGVFLSNGPGDPEPCDYAIDGDQEFLWTGHSRSSVFALVTSCWRSRRARRHEKMKFGHHGANHPVQDLGTGQVMITSQNHGFAVDESDAARQCRNDASFPV